MVTVFCASGETMRNSGNMGWSRCRKTGSTATPSARLASVIPNCVAPMYALIFWITCRARCAWRWPLATSASNWVARTRINASSAATKNPFNNTSTATASSFSATSMMASQFMLQAHLAEDCFENIFQCHDPDFMAVASEHDGHALAAALHLAQGDFEAQIFIEVMSRLNQFTQRAVGIEIRLEQECVQADQARDAPASVANFPDRHAGEMMFAALFQR